MARSLKKGPFADAHLLKKVEAQAKVRKDGFIDNKQITFRQVHNWVMKDRELK